MTDLEKAARQALDVLENHNLWPVTAAANAAIDALRAALAQQQAEPVDLDQQVRDIAAGVGLPPAEPSTVFDPILDCDCGRRWCWTDGAGWDAKQTEQRVVTGVDPISGIPFKVTLKSALAQQQAEPVVESVVELAAAVQSIMFDVYEYSRVMDGFESLEGVDRALRRSAAQNINKKIRAAIIALCAQQQAEPVVEPVVERAMRKCSLCGFEREDACEILNCGLRDWGKK
jgi:hypothetical protein